MVLIALSSKEYLTCLASSRTWAFPNQPRWGSLLLDTPKPTLPVFRAQSTYGSVDTLVMSLSLFARRAEVCLLNEQGQLVHRTIRAMCEHISNAWGLDHILTRLPAGDNLHESLLQAGFVVAAVLREHLRLSRDTYSDVNLYSLHMESEGRSDAEIPIVSV